MKSACIYNRQGKVFISAQSKTIVGLWIEDGRVQTTEQNDKESIGRLLVACLDRSKECVPHPTQDEWSKMDKIFLGSVGVRSYRTFAKTARAVNVRQDGETITIIPTKNGGPRNGYTSLDEKARTVVRTDNPARIGAEVNSAINDCE